jgi:hypothetical protein
LGAESGWCQPEAVGGGGGGGDLVVLVVGEPGEEALLPAGEHVWAATVAGGRVGAHGDDQRRCRLGRLKSAARVAPLNQIVSPAALWSSGSATAYPMRWLGLVVLVRGRTSTPGDADAVQEVLFAAGFVGSGADQPPQLVAGHFVALLSGGLVQLGGCGVTLGGTPAVDAVQPVVVFQLAAASLRAAVVVPEPDGAAVLAGQGGDDVDVPVVVADADPSHRGQVAVRGHTDRSGDLGGDVFPLVVGQDAVLGVVVDRTVPDRQGGQFPADAGGGVAP